MTGNGQTIMCACVLLFFLLFLQVVDKCGKVVGWKDASEPGTGNWMKYVRSSELIHQRNVMAVQVDEQVSRAGFETVVMKAAHPLHSNGCHKSSTSTA